MTVIGRNVVELHNVWVRYDGLTVLEDIDLQVRPGDFLGIIGPNGGGKSTLLKVLLGLVHPDRGTVRMLGGSPTQNRRLVGYVAQRSSFDRDFPASVWDVVLMGRCGMRGPLRRYGTSDVLAAERALSRVGMLEFRRKQIGRLSGGEQQRVFIARALAGEPEQIGRAHV